jgi:hypothetical protein
MRRKPQGHWRSVSVTSATTFWLLIAQGILAADGSSLLSKGPYLQAPGLDAMTILWESMTNHPATVSFGSRYRRDKEFGPITPRTMVGLTPRKYTNITTLITNGLSVTKTNIKRGHFTNLFYLYEARLTGLKPGAACSYSIQVGGAATAVHQFKTFSGKSDRVRFIAYGDSRSDSKTHRSLAKRFLAASPEFILHTGDLVMDGRDYGLWSKQFFDPVADVIDRVPVLPVPGNHEEDLKNYLAYFHMPGTKRWYSFDAGPAHVLALDYHYEKASHEQFKFAREDLLNSRARWKVVFLHYPMFNYGHHNAAWGHQAYLPLFHEAKVDLVLSGHSHLYERFRPIAPKDQRDAWAITFITTGGGGAELGSPYEHPAHAKCISTNHFVAFEATEKMLRGRAIRADGTVIDSFEMKKTRDAQSKSYLAQVYPEEWLATSIEVGASLLGKLAAVPTNTAATPVMFSLAPIKTTERPLDLEITLAPDSSPFYELEEAPLRVSTPEMCEGNQVVWAAVRATGKKRIKGPELSPPLVFQARIRGDAGETLAYGPLSRTSKTAADQAKKHYVAKPEAPERAGGGSFSAAQLNSRK